jgi:hypothetical protein
MKKIAFLAIVLFAFSTVSVFAWSSGSYATADQGGSLPIGNTSTVTVKLSKSVSMAYTSQTNGLGYSVGASHASGTKTYASSSGDSKIWAQDGLQKSIPAAPTGTASAAFGSGWTAL